MTEGPIQYIGKRVPDTRFHNGNLPQVVGVHTFEVFKADRTKGIEPGEPGFTYNHAPMMAYWNGKFYLQYLSNPIFEHVPPGRTLLCSSVDGVNYSDPVVVFPPVTDLDGKQMVMHQRMGFYISSDDRLLVLGFYGYSPTADQVPFAKYGMGRVVREVYRDNTFGPIHFIRYNVNTQYGPPNTPYPFYEQSDDAGFVAACEELLSKPLVVQQWAEENGEKDPLIRVKGSVKAFCSYHIDENTVVGLWKWMKCAYSKDEGRTWSEVYETPTVVHAGAKIWGQKTSDGRFSLLYNPTTANKHRWPLAIVTGEDGIHFDDMLCVAGDLPPLRYHGGHYKDFGFNYVRGIEEGHGTPPDGNLWVAYSVNKEDIYVSMIPVPVTGEGPESVKDKFERFPEGSFIQGYNVVSGILASVCVSKCAATGRNVIEIKDNDPFNYAKLERIFKPAEHVTVETKIIPERNDGLLILELGQQNGTKALKLWFDRDGFIKVKHGRKVALSLTTYESGQSVSIRVEANAKQNQFNVWINGKLYSGTQSYQGEMTASEGWYTLAPLADYSSLRLTTKPAYQGPDVDSDAGARRDLEEQPTQPSHFYITKMKIQPGLRSRIEQVKAGMMHE